MSKKYEKEAIIWKIITELIEHHSEFTPAAGKIDPDDKILKYFPTPLENDLKNPYNEHANRWSSVLYDAIKNVNEHFDVELKYDFKFREEWILFENVGDYWMYMIFLLKKSD